VGGFRDCWEGVLGWFSIASLAILHLLGLGRKVLDLGLAEDDVAAVWAQSLVEVFVHTGTTMQWLKRSSEKKGKEGDDLDIQDKRQGGRNGWEGSIEQGSVVGRGSNLRVRGGALENVGLGDDEEDVLALRSGCSKSDFSIQEEKDVSEFLG
jgi:hypothetical protein